MHSKGVAHLDIKPENIVIKDDGKNVRLIDFGLSRCCEKFGTLKGCVGTPSFMPPEMKNGQSWNGYKADVWALGCTIYEIVCGRKA